MSDKPEGRAAIEIVGAYYEHHLAVLLSHVADAVERFSGGELSALQPDGVVFQYSRAAKKLWSFCNMTSAPEAARFIADSDGIDWWVRGAYRQR